MDARGQSLHPRAAACDVCEVKGVRCPTDIPAPGAVLGKMKSPSREARRC